MNHQTKENVLFISGIDTNVGKTVATGMIAKALAKAGKKVITQKMIQTGCEHVSEDIEAHRQIQGLPFTDEDTQGLTCPYIFTYPCSPHMAAAKDGRRIDLETITQATRRLRETYEYVLLEGAGGLMVPNDMESLTIDYVKEQGVSPDTSHVRQAGKYQSYFAQPVRLRAIRYRGKSHRL